MQLLSWFIVGSFAVWRLTWDFASCTLNETGKCVMNLEGPFRLYDLIRWLLTRPQMPKYIREGSTCLYCVSMWAAGLISLLIPPGRESIASWLVWTIGISAPTAFWLRYVRLIYGTDAREF